jgi:hypothetical protein
VARRAPCDHLVTSTIDPYSRHCHDLARSCQRCLPVPRLDRVCIKRHRLFSRTSGSALLNVRRRWFVFFDLTVSQHAIEVPATHASRTGTVHPKSVLFSLSRTTRILPMWPPYLQTGSRAVGKPTRCDPAGTTDIFTAPALRHLQLSAAQGSDAPLLRCDP